MPVYPGKIVKISTNYPFSSCTYQVTVHDGEKNTTLSFAEVSGLKREYETVTYKHGWSFKLGYFIIPGDIKPIHITMKRGIFVDGDYLDEWFESMDKRVNVFYTEDNPLHTRDVEIALFNGYGAEGAATVTWKVRGAIPVKLEAPNFNASSNEVAIESLELVAKDIEVTYG